MSKKMIACKKWYQTSAPADKRTLNQLNQQLKDEIRVQLKTKHLYNFFKKTDRW